MIEMTQLFDITFDMFKNAIDNTISNKMFIRNGIKEDMPNLNKEEQLSIINYMYFNSAYNMTTFFGLTIMILITIFSRINVGCKTLLDAIYCTLIGLLFGVVYYNLVQPYYKADYLKSELESANSEINNFFSVS